jgi:hypothetical protein
MIFPQRLFGSTKIAARHAAAFDLEATCSGFIYALEIGQQFIMSYVIPCLSSVRRSFHQLSTGRIAIRVCCSATALGLRFCKTGRIRTAY